MIGLGRSEGPGHADNLRHRYDDLWQRVGSLGLDGVRLGLSWARVQPRARVRDVEALETYRRVVDHAHQRDLWVSVELVDGAWPSWLGMEPWTKPWVKDALARYVRLVTAEIGADEYVITSDVDELVDGYVSGQRPPWRRDALEERTLAARNLVEWMSEIRATSPDVPWGPLHSHVVGRLLEGRGPLSGVPALISRSEWNE